MFVSIAGASTTDLLTVVSELKRHGCVYDPSLSSRTKVLVVYSCNGDAKVVDAIRRCPITIAIVHSQWAFEGQCSKTTLGRFTIHRDLFGMHVSTTSLTEKERSVISTICKREGAQYETTLSKLCKYLVVADSGTLLHNEKILYAERHPSIEKILFREFVVRFGRSSLAAAGESSIQAECMLRTSIAQSFTSRVRKLEHVICYCHPPDLVNPAVRKTLHQAGVTRVPLLTSSTTHVIVLNANTDSIFPRPSLEFVSLQWIEDCVRQQQDLSTDIYRVLVTYRPTITFGSLSAVEKKTVRSALSVSHSLPCRVEDLLLLGPQAEIEKAMAKCTGCTVEKEPNGVSKSYFATTHLVVPRRCQRESPKVQALIKRYIRFKRHECSVVDVQWITDSLAAGAWVDSEAYTTPMETLISEMLSASVAPLHSHKHIPVDPKVIVACEEGTNTSNSRSPSKHNRGSSIDSQQVNLSLEAMVGQLERRVNQQADNSSASVGDAFMRQGHAFQRPPHLSSSAVAESAATPSTRVNGEPLVVAASFATGLSPLASKDALQSRSISFMKNSGGGGAGTIPIPCRSSALESQMVVYCHGEEVEFSVPPPLKPSAPPLAILGCGASLATNRSEEGTASTTMKLLLAKFLREDTETVQKLRALGVTVVDRVDEASHFVVPKIAKTETVLCCIAGGKWLLRPTFVAECTARGEIPPVESHEWCGAAPSGEASQPYAQLVNACRTQRQLGGGAFRGWHVVLTCKDSSRAESFSRVLQCGGCASVRSFSVPDVVKRFAVKCTNPTAASLWGDVVPNVVLADDNLWDEHSAGIAEQSLGSCVKRLEYLVHVLCNPHRGGGGGGDTTTSPPLAMTCPIAYQVITTTRKRDRDAP